MWIFGSGQNLMNNHQLFFRRAERLFFVLLFVLTIVRFLADTDKRFFKEVKQWQELKM